MASRDGNARAGLGQPTGDGLADAFAAARDERRATRQIEQFFQHDSAPASSVAAGAESARGGGCPSVIQVLVAGVGWLVVLVCRMVRRGWWLHVRGLVAVRIGRPGVVRAGRLWRPLVAGVAGVANFDSRFGRAAVL